MRLEPCSSFERPALCAYPDLEQRERPRASSGRNGKGAMHMVSVAPANICLQRIPKRPFCWTNRRSTGRWLKRPTKFVLRNATWPGTVPGTEPTPSRIGLPPRESTISASDTSRAQRNLRARAPLQTRHSSEFHRIKHGCAAALASMPSPLSIRQMPAETQDAPGVLPGVAMRVWRFK